MKKFYLKESMVAIIFFAMLAGITYIGIQNTSEGAHKEQISFLEKAVKRAAVQCYATEGMYPPDIKYIEDNYGVIINHQRYIVHYEAFAANIMPDISVLEKAGGNKLEE